MNLVQFVMDSDTRLWMQNYSPLTLCDSSGILKYYSRGNTAIKLYSNDHVVPVNRKSEKNKIYN